ncbi:hypothetical protein AA0498_2165 [Acidomonas methanolica]|nr:hypothetical protein AA0498_2165 [Acidomonas methanolica]
MEARRAEFVLIMGLLTLWAAWSGPIGVVAGYGGALLRARAQMRRDHLDAGAQALQLVASYQRREAQLIAERERSLAYEMDARARARIAADVLQVVHVEAISARLRCHDLEMRQGLPLTDFPLFPDFPFREIPPSQEAHASSATGG